MPENILNVSDLSCKIEDKEILKGINLQINRGEVHVLMGPNGAGKSTLGHALMGNPSYSITGGKILFKNEDITSLTTDKRANKGLFLSFQEPLEVPGLTLSSFLRNAVEQKRGEKIRLFAFKKELKGAMDILQMSDTYADRDLNLGFSGGEKKKAEILQLMLLRPDLAILDETDSGLDVDAVRQVSQGIEAYRKTSDGALLIITHSTRILDSLKVDYTHVLVNGRIVETGDASIVDEINKSGYGRFEEMAQNTSNAKD